MLHRSTRTQRLTTEGERFLLSCREILSGIDEAEAQIRSGDPTGDLRISAPRAFGLDQVARALPAFVARYPELTVHFSLSDTFANLIEDNVDVAVRMGQLQDPSLRSRKLCDLQRVLVASPAYLAARGSPVTPNGLARLNCLMWDGQHDHLNQWPFLVNGKVENLSVQGNFRGSDGSTMFEPSNAFGPIPMLLTLNDVIAPG